MTLLEPKFSILPADLLARLRARSCHWHAMTGGRSNHVWRITDDTSTPRLDVVLKIFDINRRSAFFPNDVAAERTVLRLLSPLGLAAKPIDFTPPSTAGFAAYEFVAGQAGGATARQTGHALARLHHVETALFLAEAGPILRAVAEPHGAKPAGKTVFLHGDPMASNLIARLDGQATFIDWQCAGLGDPRHDLALALSPGMRVLYGLKPWTMSEIAEFWTAYADPETAMALADDGPHYRAQIVNYCLDRVAAGDTDYFNAAQTERAAPPL